MTSLFQEYEQRRTIRTNPESLIGKQFCWGNYQADPFVITEVSVLDGLEHIGYRYLINDYSTYYVTIDEFINYSAIPLYWENA
jgi:hypothetical protein